MCNSKFYVLGRHCVLVLLTAFLVLGLAACGDSEEATNNHSDNHANHEQEQPTGIEVAGTWATEYETVEEITDTKWDYAAIVKYDNDQRFAITQNPEDDAFGPNKFNKLVWTKPVDDAFYYCMITFGQETLEDAENTTEVADETALETDGCNGFSWTKMTRQ